MECHELSHVSAKHPPQKPFGEAYVVAVLYFALVYAQTTDIPAYCSAEIASVSSTGTNTMNLCTALCTVT